METIKDGLNLLVMQFREIVHWRSAGKKNAKATSACRLIGKPIAFDLAQFRGDGLILGVFPVGLPIPIDHPFQKLLLAGVHALPRPTTDQLVARHQRSIRRFADGSGRSQMVVNSVHQNGVVFSHWMGRCQTALVESPRFCAVSCQDKIRSRRDLPYRNMRSRRNRNISYDSNTTSCR